MAKDWWEQILEKHHAAGVADAQNGRYELPHPDDNDPQDQDENDAYCCGWRDERRRLGDEFKWEK